MGQEEILKQSFKEAASIAAVVPEALRPVAFQRALDEILGGSASDISQRRTSRPSSSGRAKVNQGKLRDTAVEDLVSKINRTQHPEVNDSMPVLQRSLAILQIAKDLGVDGLAAPRIAEILTEKFRIKTHRTHVSEQLSAATKLVDREKEGRGFTYRIMGAGEALLAEFSEGGVAEAAATAHKGTSRKPKKRRAGKAPKPKAESTKKQKSTGRGRPGPKAAIKMLIAAGFFSEARTMGDIQKRLKDKSGYVYKPTDLSPALGRLLRDGELDRDRNEDGKYEYQQS